MKLLSIFILSSVLLLAGCVTNPADCDPTTGDVSLLTKFNCNYSGTYDSRIEQKQAIFDNEKALNSEFKAIYAAIEHEKAQSNASVKSKQKSQTSLNNSVNNLLGQIKQKTKGRADIQKQISNIENKMQETQNNPSKSVMEKQLELESLRGQVFDLQSDLGLK
ncbi:hypothetical protein [Moellerella wisconsensis]|uniref:Lipoprotein n=2 Tax=Moellerella wisconsensis TaxID=158849 RepID=A0A9Q8Q2Y2_9GAMM|nr:hypothetical protein [Moellerella wisconsensis]UNH24458.1 hypothetical protein MNY68_01450 [Moellerella wisconsensis]UNH27562.1 hypothetical protein MNY64_01550 [Moellerella wisconsensis]UNH31036.1 hypothetical protein MNY72_01525 [Moellerella wisconsensis]UNH39182.1 hypothetical protein MNY70_01475 [Moellerella wisconsensis]UNH42703.1 hypothetical protein MNY66_01455 [Moellerella wisconsensis]